jgi:predicted GTPase
MVTEALKSSILLVDALVNTQARDPNDNTTAFANRHSVKIVVSKWTNKREEVKIDNANAAGITRFSKLFFMSMRNRIPVARVTKLCIYVTNTMSDENCLHNHRNIG